jgi:glycine/D-amino acid oxidase-like deaminating enzyme
MDVIDALVAGAGVIGLACADALARVGREVVVVESEPKGSGISARNSEVVHSGLYYPPASVKARVCVRGRRLLYDFCERHGAALVLRTRFASAAARPGGGFAVALDDATGCSRFEVRRLVIAAGLHA